MNWQVIGAVGELIGGIAVLITLVYLAIQLKTANRQTRVSMAQESLTGTQRYGLEIATNPDLAAFIARIRRSSEDLDEVDSVRLSGLVNHFLAAWAVVFLMWEEGYITDAEWQRIVENIESFAGGDPNVQSMVAEAASHFSESFETEVKRIIGQT